MKNSNKLLIILVANLISLNNLAKSPEAKSEEPQTLHKDGKEYTFPGDEHRFINDEVANQPKSLQKLARCEIKAIFKDKKPRRFKTFSDAMIKCLEEDGRHAEAHAIRSIKIPEELDKSKEDFSTDIGSVHHLDAIAAAGITRRIEVQAYADENMKMPPSPLDGIDGAPHVKSSEALKFLDAREKCRHFSEVLRSIDLSQFSRFGFFKASDRTHVESILSKLFMHDCRIIQSEPDVAEEENTASE